MICRRDANSECNDDRARIEISIRQIYKSHQSSLLKCRAVYLKAADIRDFSKVSRWKLDPTHHRPAIRRDPDARDITGNEIKKIANNSNPNCHGHIPRQTAIRSRGGGYGDKRKRDR